MMLYEEVNTTNGLYLVDFQLVNKIIHDSYYLQTLNTSANLKTEKEGFGLPETYHWEANHKAAESRAAAAPKFAATKDCPSSLMKGSDIELIRKRLYELEKDGRKAKDELRNKQQDASNRSMKNIRRSVKTYENLVLGSTIVRDASAEIMLLASGVVTGGAATLSAAAAGSFLKGVFKWQDTGNLGASVFQAGVSFITVLMPDPEKGTSTARRILVFLTKANVEYSGNLLVGLAEGNTISDAAVSAGISVVSGSAINLAFPGGENVVKNLLNNSLKGVPVPVGLKTITQGVALSAAGQINTQHIMTRVKRMQRTSSQKFQNVAINDRVLGDIAILGPDKSTQGRTWT